MSDQGFVEISNGTLYYEVHGNGAPIVFIHGFTLDHRMWQSQVGYFSKTSRVITYDVRGFGQSSQPIDTYTHYDDLLALLDHLEIPKAHLVGLSMGGGIASGFAVLHPDRVLTLALLDSDIHGYPSSVDWNVHAGEVGVDDAKVNWLAHDVFAQTRTKQDVTAELTKIVQDYSGWHWLHNDPGTRIDVAKRMSEIQASTEVITGEKDLAYFQDIADVLIRSIPNARRTIVPGVGHMVNMEAPNEINMIIHRLIFDIQRTQ